MRTKPLLSLACILTIFTLAGCSNFEKYIATESATLKGNTHPLKTKKDLEIEALLTTGVWKYQRQADDCSDTTWNQRFHTNRYYESSGSACLLADAFSLSAESWHIKDKMLYIANLSPIDGEDIILKYQIVSLDKETLILSSKDFQYTFIK